MSGFDGLQLAGFQVSITGRFWVSTEGRIEAPGVRHMLTARFRVWLQNTSIRPDWDGIELIYWPEYSQAGFVDVMVKGNGDDLRRLIEQRQDIFAAYIQMMPEQRKDNGH
jgi:hypothetical protein